jgi:hypothetical protein
MYQGKNAVQALVLVFMLVQLLFVPSLSAEDDTPLSKGVRALQFEINNNFDLSSFQGSTISFKKHTSDRSAYRIGITSRVSFSDNEDERNDSLLGTSDGTSLNLGLRTQKIFYKPVFHRSSFFYGLGPVFSMSYTKGTSESNNGSKSENKSTTFSGGISFVGGVEWFPTSSIGLLAEYESELAYKHNSSTSKSENPDGEVSKRERRNKYFSLSSLTVKFGVSVYF